MEPPLVIKFERLITLRINNELETMRVDMDLTTGYSSNTCVNTKLLNGNMKVTIMDEWY